MIPDNCSYSITSGQSLIYFLQATCKSDKIDLLFMHRVYLEKNQVAMIVVFADLAIGICLFILFLYLRSMQHITKTEIEESVVTA